MKLQEAYAAEKNDVGDWAAIGYKGPGSNATNTSISSTFHYGQDGSTAGSWKATAQVALNDCVNGVWSVATTYVNGSITTTANISDEDKCGTPLTPNFCKIATSGSCSAAASGAGNGGAGGGEG